MIIESVYRYLVDVADEAFDNILNEFSDPFDRITRLFFFASGGKAHSRTDPSIIRS